MTELLIAAGTALVAGGVGALLVDLLARRPLARHLDRVREDGDRAAHQLQRTLEAVTMAIDARDPASAGHVRRVRAFSLEIAREMGLPPPERHAIRMAAGMHDIGKLVVPDHVLCKPGRLSEAEFEKVRAHPGAGVEILSPAGIPEPILAIIRHHHERWDGTGYPDGLRGEAIPIGARVLAVADAFEALTADRAYRRRLSPPEAAALIATWSGVQFDPRVVEALRARLEAVVAAGVGDAEGPGDAAVAGDSCSAPAAADAGGFGDALHQGVAPIVAAHLAPPGPRTPPASGLAAGVRDAFAAQREVFALYEIAQTLGSSPRLMEVLDLVVSRIAQLVPFRTCVVYLAEEGGDGLAARFVSGANAAALRGRRLRPGEGITGWAAEHRCSRFSGSADLDLAGTGVDPAGYSTVAAFPLCQGDAMQGVITLYYPGSTPCLDDHVRLMEIIARLAAAAVANGRLGAFAGAAALTDELTHLPNARHLGQVFEQETIRSQQSGQPLALVEMDLDEFRALNERFGPQVGDRFLMEVGRVLRSHLRERDVLVRVGDDEFAALLPGSGFAAAALLSERLQQAIDAFALRVEEGGSTARAGLSAGIAIYPLDGETLDDLLVRASLNRARNKQSRRDARATSPNVVPFRGPGAGRPE